ncbi:MAG: hypothetical protein WBC74_01340 [Candidatus Omnitrophota bacterium]
MGQKKRTHIKVEQKVKRRKRREKLAKAGKNPDEYFYDGFCVARRLKQQ